MIYHAKLCWLDIVCSAIDNHLQDLLTHCSNARLSETCDVQQNLYENCLQTRAVRVRACQRVE